MSAELAAAVVLVYLAGCAERMAKALDRIWRELGTARWERGVRDSLAREALEKLAPAQEPAVVEDDDETGKEGRR